jgi:O-antigen/teichoic acid export membrane protein
MILFPEPILNFLFGSKAVESAFVARLLVTGTFFAGVAAIVGLAIAGIGRMWDGLAINIIWGTMFNKALRR